MGEYEVRDFRIFLQGHINPKSPEVISDLLQKAVLNNFLWPFQQCLRRAFFVDWICLAADRR